MLLRASLQCVTCDCPPMPPQSFPGQNLTIASLSSTAVLANNVTLIAFPAASSLGPGTQSTSQTYHSASTLCTIESLSSGRWRLTE
jgi:hypothetical protein